MIKFDPSMFASLPHDTVPPDVIIGTRRFYELNPGDKFKALILDIKPGQVTIRLDGGDTFTARSLVLPESRIGEESLFVVKENDMQGHISLEMGKLTPEERQDNVLREALRNAGISVNEETIKIGRALIKGNLPLDVNTLQKAAFFYYSPPEGKTTPLDGVVFLLKGNIPAEQALVNIFNDMLAESWLLQKNLAQIINGILRAEPEQAKALLKALSFENAAPSFSKNEPMTEYLPDIRKLAQKKFYLPVNHARSGRLEPLNDYYVTLDKTLGEIIDASGGIKSVLTEAAESAKEAIRFMSQVNGHKEYFQIPFVNLPNEQKYQADLIVYKDKKNQSGDINKTYSALIALDTAGLARTEAYIQKTGGQVNIAFRCDTSRALKTLSASSGILTQALRKKNINLSGLTFGEITEAFTVLTDEPNSQPKAEKPEGTKRFTFDMRI